MIKTRFDISLEIDEKPFSVTVNDKPNQAQKQELEEISDKYSAEFAVRETLQFELEEKTNEFDINKSILEHGSVLEKSSVWLVQKSLNKEIFALKAKLKELNKNISKLYELLEDGYRKRFDLLVSGVDKIALKKEITDKSISYQSLFEAMGKLIIKEEEKK